MRGDEQRPGDHRVICDFSGFKTWASECVKTWDGYIVHRRFVGSEAQRHPQEFVRAIPDNSSVKNARPDTSAVYLAETLTTEDGLPILTGAGSPVTTLGG